MDIFIVTREIGFASTDMKREKKDTLFLRVFSGTKHVPVIFKDGTDTLEFIRGDVYPEQSPSLLYSTFYRISRELGIEPATFEVWLDGYKFGFSYTGPLHHDKKFRDGVPVKWM